jgi:pimeloyl-ACP methyl ester carboxylesterase
MTEPTPPAWTHHTAEVNSITLHYVAAGPADGPLVILLHGFPEFWYSWRFQIPALAAAGYRVIAPDMRGYNYSARPRGAAAYHVRHLTADIAGLIAHAGVRSASIVAHDWGGVVGWHLPMRYPDLVDRLAILNAPHPGRYAELLRDSDQLQKSWYVFFFQIPLLPELMLTAGDYAGLANLFRATTRRPDAFTDADIARYQAAFRQPGAPTAAINYYRALGRANLTGDAPQIRRITCPTLLLWGEQDVALSIQNTTGLSRWVPNLRVTRIPDASHWVQVDAPETVNAALLEFLGTP